MKTLGQIAYDTYCGHRNWQSVRGEPLPKFENQSPDLILGWEKAADAVSAALADRRASAREDELVRLTDVLMQVVAGNISTGKAREILRVENYPEAVIMTIMAPPAP